jgi:hypothetical protein
MVGKLFPKGVFALHLGFGVEQKSEEANIVFAANTKRKVNWSPICFAARKG